MQGSADHGFTPTPADLFPRPAPVSSTGEALQRLAAHDGVRQVVLLGSDGLVIGTSQSDGFDSDSLAAATPAVVAAARILSEGLEAGGVKMVVLELEGLVAVLHPASAELILVALVASGVGLRPLLSDLRSEGRRLSEIL